MGLSFSFFLFFLLVTQILSLFHGLVSRNVLSWVSARKERRLTVAEAEEEHPFFRGHLLRYLFQNAVITPAMREEVEILSVRVYKSVFVNVGGVAQRVVSTNSFHGAPRHDCITLRGINENEGVEQWYAKVLLIFRVTMGNTAHRLLFIHYFNEVQRTTLPLPRLRLLSANQGLNFAVISITSITDVAFVAPDYSTAQPLFHVNEWVKANNLKKTSKIHSATL